MSNDNRFGIKGLTITVPVIGRISIGKRVEKDGKSIPKMDNEFSITSQVKVNGEWEPHPLEQGIIKSVADKAGVDSANQKLREIPITFMFNDPKLNISTQYAAFDRDNGRPLCVGHGEKAKRFDKSSNSTTEVQCPGSSICTFGLENRCKQLGRLHVMVDGQDDQFSTFIFRTAGYNSIKVLLGKINSIQGLMNGRLAGLPLTLKLRAKSTTQSYGRPIFYADVTLRNGMSAIEAKKVTDTYHATLEEAGMSQENYEEVYRQGLANGAFAEEADDGMEIIEEFMTTYDSDEGDFAESGEQENSAQLGNKQSRKGGSTLAGLESVETPPAQSVKLLQAEQTGSGPSGAEVDDFNAPIISDIDPAVISQISPAPEPVLQH